MHHVSNETQSCNFGATYARLKNPEKMEADFWYKRAGGIQIIFLVLKPHSVKILLYLNFTQLMLNLKCGLLIPTTKLMELSTDVTAPAIRRNKMFSGFSQETGKSIRQLWEKLMKYWFRTTLNEIKSLDKNTDLICKWTYKTLIHAISAPWNWYGKLFRFFMRHDTQFLTFQYVNCDKIVWICWGEFMVWTSDQCNW